VGAQAYMAVAKELISRHRETTAAESRSKTRAEN
jgi:hypothetical protein